MVKDSKKIEWILRVALFGEFLGHGIFALQLKSTFVGMLVAFFGFVGITLAANSANVIMYFIGALDILTAILALIFPFRLLLAWASVWAFLTALARPIAGDPIWDFVERWANIGVPLALLYVRGFPKKMKEWFR